MSDNGDSSPRSGAAPRRYVTNVVPSSQSPERDTATREPYSDTDSHADHGSDGEPSDSEYAPSPDEGSQDESGGEEQQANPQVRRPRRGHRSFRLNRPIRTRDVEPSVTPWSHGSFRLSRNRPQVEEEESDDEPFAFVTGDQEPTATMKKKTKTRAKKALKALKIKPPPKVKEEKEKVPSCWARCRKRLKGKKKDKAPTKKKKVEKPPPATKLSPQMKKANNEGQSMIKSIAFPALPALFQDLWVYLELLVTIAAFAFAMLDFFPIEGHRVYTFTYLGLTVFAMILALFDAYVYFIELGSCGRAIRYVCARSRSQNGNMEEGFVAEDVDEEPKGKGCFKAHWREYFSTFFELGRNLASEFILYPLLVFDLFDFVVDIGYRPEGHIGRADFSLFVVGSFYLLLAVYIMRVFVIAGSIFSLIQITSNKKLSSADSNNTILLKFCLHVLGQIAVHLSIIVAVGAKISNENPVESDSMIFENETDFNSSTMIFTGFGSGSASGMLLNESVPDESGLPNVSPFLWVVMVLGWIIPIVGIIIFFVVNVYWMREFSISFWLNMISLLQGASFAETVFGGDGLSPTKDQALEFVEQSEYKRVKKQLKKFKSPSFWTKFFYPSRIPYAAFAGFVYDIVILTFVAALMLTYQDGTVRIVVFKDDHIMTTTFLFSAICILVANFHALLLLNFLLVILVTVIGLTILFALFVSPLIFCLYFPMVGIVGYGYVFKDCFRCGKTSDKKKKKEKEEKRQNGTIDTKKDTVIENKNALIDGEKTSVKVELEDFELPNNLRETSVTSTSL